jgi:hypothetical protein
MKPPANNMPSKKKNWIKQLLNFMSNHLRYARHVCLPLMMKKQGTAFTPLQQDNHRLPMVLRLCREHIAQQSMADNSISAHLCAPHHAGLLRLTQLFHFLGLSILVK